MKFYMVGAAADDAPGLNPTSSAPAGAAAVPDAPGLNPTDFCACCCCCCLKTIFLKK